MQIYADFSPLAEFYGDFKSPSHLAQNITHKSCAGICADTGVDFPKQAKCIYSVESFLLNLCEDPTFLCLFFSFLRESCGFIKCSLSLSHFSTNYIQYTSIIGVLHKSCLFCHPFRKELDATLSALLLHKSVSFLCVYFVLHFDFLELNSEVSWEVEQRHILLTF